MTQPKPPQERLSALLVDIINTPDVRNLLIDIGREWINQWSGSAPLKKGISKPASFLLSKSLAASKTKGLSDVFAKPEHIEALIHTAPQLMTALSSIRFSAMKAVDSLPIHRKKQLFETLFSKVDGDTGKQVFPIAVHIVEEIYKSDPLFFSSKISPVIEKWVSQTDFAEVKSLLDASREDVSALLENIIKIIFEYPAKLVALLSNLPEIVNLILSLANQLLAQFNAMPADIFTDLLLSLLKPIDAASIGKIFTRLNEVVRQLHTGSTLIGEMDAPQFTSDLREKIRDFMAEIDPALTIKARNALIDGRETVIGVLIEAAESRPELLNLWLSQLAAKRNSDIRLFKRKIQVLETLPEEEAVTALSAALSNWNAYDLSQTVNAIARMLNRINAFKPDVIEALVTEFVNTLDRYEIEESLDWIFRDLGRAARPIFRMTAPLIVRELEGFFQPGEEDDGYDDAMDQMRERLRSLLLSKEDKNR